MTVYSILPPPATIPRFLTGSPEERVAAAIAELPTTDADAVAEYLWAYGADGIVGSSEYCPVAQYLRWRARYPVSVAAGSVAAGDAFTAMARRPLPAAVVDFYRRFDHGEYPDLIIKPQEALSPMEPRS